MSIIFVTHDLGVISEMADRVMVMYGGRKCEEALATSLFQEPLHPYTQGLIRVPSPAGREAGAIGSDSRQCSGTEGYAGRVSVP